jgi:hypothetical protein
VLLRLLTQHRSTMQGALGPLRRTCVLVQASRSLFLAGRVKGCPSWTVSADSPPDMTVLRLRRFESSSDDEHSFEVALRDTDATHLCKSMSGAVQARIAAIFSMPRVCIKP